MSDRTLSVKIQAQDDASKVFKAVGDSAKTLGDALEEISDQGGDAFDGVTESAGEMGQAIETAAQQGTTASRELATTAREVEDAYKNVGQTLLAFGATGVAALALATNSANQLQSAMANVNSIANLSESQLASLTDQVRDLAVELGKNPTELADGLYDLLSSGIEVTDAMDVLRTSTVAAGAGLTQTAVSARAITAVLNAYGMSASKAGDVSDLLFSTVDKGVVSFEALANNLGSVLAPAAALKVPFEEIAAAFAELTLQGIGVSQAETGIAAFMRSALAPTQAMTEALREQGYVSAELLLQTGGITDFLDFLMVASGGSSAALQELLGSTEATTTALALLRNEGENFNSMLSQMEASTQGGAYTQEVFATQMDTTAAAMDRLSAAALDFQITIGQALQPAITPGIDTLTAGINRLNDYLNLLPDSGQSAAAGIGAVISAASLGAGTLILLAPRIVETRNALQTLGGVTGILGGGLTRLVGMVNPVTIGLTALSLAALPVIKSFLDSRVEAQNLEVALQSLDDTVFNLRMEGLGAKADELAGFTDEIERLAEMGNKAADQMILNPQMWGGPGEYMGDAFSAYVEGLRSTSTEAERAAANIKLAFTDSRIDLDAFLSQISQLRAEMEADVWDEKGEGWFLGEIAGLDMTQFLNGTEQGADNLNALGQAAESATAPVEKLFDLFVDLPAALDDLRLDGQGSLAKDLEAMSKTLESTFIKLSSPEMYGLGSMGAPWIQSLELGEEQVEQLGTAWDRVWKGMSSGVLDNTALMAEWNRILNDPSIAPEVKVEQLTALSQGLSQFYDSAKAMQQQQVDFLADGANVLSWWLQYQDQVRSATLAQGEWSDAADKGAKAIGDTVTPMEAAFEASVRWAQGMNDASDALDQALRTFGQIDSLAQRSASSASIADTLIGAPGELGELQDLWDRINAGTSDAILSQEAYNQAIASGIAIQESNVRVQDDLNVVRAMQIPLLAEQQLAYERNIGALTQMTAQEQQHALMLQDSGIQAQIAQQYSLAYSASVGEIPKEVVTEMIANTAQADPAMASILEQMGLIEIGAEGEITVNFPDADATIGAINRMTLAFLYFQQVATGQDAYEIAVEIYGEDEAKELFGLLDENDGKTSTSTLTVQTKMEGPGDFGSFLGGRIKDLMGIEDDTATITIEAVDNATAIIEASKGNLDDIDGDYATLSIEAVDNASGVIGTVSTTLRNLDGQTATTYINTVTTQTLRQVYESRGIGQSPFAHGGIPAFATGGVANFVPFYGAEGNRPELLHFAGGGTAPIYTEGVYAVPPMTYVSPANANPGLQQGGGDIYLSVPIYGNVYGISDLTQQVAREMVPALRDVIEDVRGGQVSIQ